jgi:hypothetical protein
LQEDVALISTGFGFPNPDLYLYRLRHGQWQQTRKFAGRGGAFMTFTDHDVVIENTVFRIDARDRLIPVQTLTVEDSAEQPPTVAVSKDTAVLGFGAQDGTRGAVYVFRRHGHHWRQHQKLLAIDGQPGDHFGSALSIQGNILAVGAPGRPSPDSSCDTTPSGLAYVFKEQGGTWFEHQVIESPEHCASAFGSAVAINRHGLAVGDQPARPAHFAQAYLYRRLGGQYVFENAASGLESGAPHLVATRATLYVGFPAEGLGIGGGIQFSPGQVQIFNVGRDSASDDKQAE